ncbi:MAG: hypothetical protein Q4G58_13130 [bacterium]|nr:hypothetical protein [bacterium]
MDYKHWIKELIRLKKQYWDLHGDDESETEERTKLYCKPYMVLSYIISLVCIYHLLGTTWEGKMGIITYLIMMMGVEDIMQSLVIISVLFTAQGSIFFGNSRWLSRIAICIQVIFVFTMLSYILVHVNSVNEYIERASGSILLLLSSIVFCTGTFLKKAEK